VAPQTTFDCDPTYTASYVLPESDSCEECEIDPLWSLGNVVRFDSARTPPLQSPAFPIPDDNRGDGGGGGTGTKTRRGDSLRAKKLLGMVTAVRPVESAPVTRTFSASRHAGVAPTVLFVDDDPATMASRSADDGQSPFNEPDSPSNIVFNEPTPDGRQTIRGGTLVKLVQYLTSERDVDSEFVTELLLSHRGFTTSEALLKLLHQRFRMRRPTHVDPAAFEKMLFAIRLRCVNVLKSWFTLRPEDFSDSTELAELARKFVSHFEQHTITAKNLTRLLDRAVASDFQQRTEVTHTQPPPEPLLFEDAPLTPRSADDIHPEELARQLSLIEFNYWKAIRPHEFMNQAWMGRDGPAKAPHITAMIRMTNNVTRWVMSEILAAADVRRRVVVLNTFILAAERCLAINSFNAMMEIFSALQSSAIHRLRNTWSLLPPRTWDCWDKLVHAANSEGNFQAYRDKLRTCVELALPVIPYLGIYLTFLTFINDGNPDYIPGTKLINFNKWRATSSVIKEILSLQTRPLNFTPVRPIREYILAALRSPEGTGEHMYERSLALEDGEKKVFTKEERAMMEKLSRDIFRDTRRTRSLRRMAAKAICMLTSGGARGESPEVSIPATQLPPSGPDAVPTLATVVPSSSSMSQPPLLSPRQQQLSSCGARQPLQQTSAPSCSSQTSS